MIDTICLAENIAADNVAFNSHLDAMCACMEIKEISSKIGVCYTGNESGLKCKLTNDAFYINGSLNKWYMGNNYQPFSMCEAMEALGMVADQFGMNGKRTTIKRIDIGAVVETDQLAVLYLPAFISWGRKKRVMYGDSTLMFYTRAESMLFYDKVLEIKEHAHNVPAELQKRHLLRCEWQIRRCPRVLGKINLSQVDEDMLNGLKSRFFNNFVQIDKLTNFKIDMYTEDYYAIMEKRAYVAACGGLAKMLADIDMKRKAGMLTSVKASRAKKRYKDAMQPLPIESETKYKAMVEELTNKLAAICMDT